jgi:hypothetical protein
MEKDKNIEKEQAERSRDDKCTAGNLPENQEQFDNTSWAESADHGASSTEAERKNVSKTLPDSATKEKG